MIENFKDTDLYNFFRYLVMYIIGIAGGAVVCSTFAALGYYFCLYIANLVYIGSLPMEDISKAAATLIIVIGMFGGTRGFEAARSVQEKEENASFQKTRRRARVRPKSQESPKENPQEEAKSA